MHRETFAHRRLYTQRFLHVFTQRTFYTQNILHKCFAQRCFCAGHFYTQNLFHREAFAQNSFYTNKFLHRKTLTEKLVHTDCTKKTHRNLAFTQSSFYTAKTFFRTETFTHFFFNAHQFLQTDDVYTQKLFPTEVLGTEGFTHSNFHTDAFTHRQLLHREALLPLLDLLPFVFPLSSFLLFVSLWFFSFPMFSNF